MGLKVPEDDSAPDPFWSLFDLLIGELQKRHFYNFGISGRAPEPQKPTIFIFGDTKIPQIIHDRTSYFEK